jgi:hypothetical protein
MAAREASTVLVGLPVVATLHWDGSVSLSVCPEELLDAASEAEASDAQLATIKRALAERRLVTDPMQSY